MKKKFTITIEYPQRPVVYILELDESGIELMTNALSRKSINTIHYQDGDNIIRIPSSILNQYPVVFEEIPLPLKFETRFENR